MIFDNPSHWDQESGVTYWTPFIFWIKKRDANIQANERRFMSRKKKNRRDGSKARCRILFRWASLRLRTNIRSLVRSECARVKTIRDHVRINFFFFFVLHGSGRRKSLWATYEIDKRTESYRSRSRNNQRLEKGQTKN